MFESLEFTFNFRLIESALGKPKELLHDKYMEKPMSGFDCTKALGYWAPGAEKTVEDGEFLSLVFLANFCCSISFCNLPLLISTVNTGCFELCGQT